MKEGLYRFFIGSEQFEKEFWEEVKLFIIFSLAFTIAFTWRQTIFDTTESLVKFFIHIQSSTTLSIITSLSTTIVCLVLIFLVSKFMQNK